MDNIGPGAGDANTSPAGAGSSNDPVVGDVVKNEEAITQGSAEYAKTKEHRMTHLPNQALLRSLREGLCPAHTEEK